MCFSVILSIYLIRGVIKLARRFVDIFVERKKETGEEQHSVMAQINKSYFYDIDTTYNWGNISYFTFFSEFNRPWRGAAGIEAACLVVVFVISSFWNVDLLYSTYKNRTHTTSTQYFISNLAISDLLFVTSALLIAAVRLATTWPLGDVTCNLLTYSMFVCGFTMAWTMTMISIDRRQCIVGLNNILIKRHIFGICVSIWMVSLFVFSPIAIFFNLKDVRTDNGSIQFCTLVWPQTNLGLSIMFTSGFCLVGVLFPLSITSVNYYRIFKRLQTSRQAVASITSRQGAVIPRQVTTTSRHGTNTSRQTTTTSPTDKGKGRNIRVVKVMLLIVVMYFLMWTPLMMTLGFICHDVSLSENMIPSHALLWTTFIAYANSCVNPFLYGYVKRQEDMFKCRRYSCCSDVDVPPRTMMNNSVHALQACEDTVTQRF